MSIDWDTLRVFNIALGAVTVFLMVRRGHWWVRQDFPARLALFALLVAVLVNSYAALEVLLHAAGAVSGGLRVLGVTIFLAYTLVALAYVPRRAERGHRLRRFTDSTRRPPV